jgi:hypothetical protein
MAATVRSFAVLTLLGSTLGAQPSEQPADFRHVRWGMDRAQVLSTEGVPPSQVGERGAEVVVRYSPVRFAGLDCRVVYIFAKDKLVRTKYVFQREHEEKNDFLVDFTMVDAFLTGILEHSAEQRVLWRDDLYKTQPERYGVAIAEGHLQYSTQWKGSRTVVTHALTGEQGSVTHEIEYVSVELERWEDQVTKDQERPGDQAPKAAQAGATP